LSQEDPRKTASPPETTEELKKKVKIRSHISGNIEAAKQFLVVAIGVGLTNAIVEKLKYAIDANQPSPQGAVAEDPFFHFPSFVLFVFGVYAIRFFFNNYIYLHQSYDDQRLDELEAEGRSLKPLIFSSGLDLGLSIFTGVMMTIISMTLSNKGDRLKYLLIFLVLHYAIDAAVLGRNIFTRKDEPGFGREFKKVFSWLFSNVIFIMIYLGLLFLDLAKDYTDLLLFQCMMVIWLANSVINLWITYVFRDQTP
jgi:hypothetical protein